jgi:hypothetical protein
MHETEPYHAEVGVHQNNIYVNVHVVNHILCRSVRLPRSANTQLEVPFNMYPLAHDSTTHVPCIQETDEALGISEQSMPAGWPGRGRMQPPPGSSATNLRV